MVAGKYISRDKDLTIHAVACEDEKAVGSGRIYFDGDDYVIDRVAVRYGFRGKGYGDFIVRLLINKAMLCGAEQITLSSPASRQGFFEKIGFRPQQPDEKRLQQDEIVMVLKTGNLCKSCGCGQEGK